jgi:hypothetical protein
MTETTDEAGRDMAEISNAERLARAVLLFHDSAEWTDQQREVWTALTGEHDATTRVLCDLARRVRNQEGSTAESQTIDGIENLCRIICEAEQVDPDRESIGCGGVIPRDQKYKLWEARRPQAEAIFAAGFVVGNWAVLRELSGG